MDPYPGLVRKATHLSYTIIHRHLFWDGCKRTGIHVMLYFCALNGYVVHASTDELETVAIATASGSLSEAELEAWIRAHLSLSRGPALSATRSD